MKHIYSNKSIFIDEYNKNSFYLKKKRNKRNLQEHTTCHLLCQKFNCFCRGGLGVSQPPPEVVWALPSFSHLSFQNGRSMNSKLRYADPYARTVHMSCHARGTDSSLNLHRRKAW